MPERYTLRMFDGENEVGTSTVAIVPGVVSYPTVGQTVDDKWKVTKILKNSGSEFHVRVERLRGTKHR